MTDVAEARLLGRISESAVAVVDEQAVGASHGRHEEIGISVVVDVGERRADADLAGDPDAGGPGDVVELAVAQISPELVATQLVHEVDIQASVSIDVGDGDPVAVVVVHQFVRFARVVGDTVHERDAALEHAILEPEIVKDLEAAARAELRQLPLTHPRRVEDLLGVGNPWERRRRGQGPQCRNQFGATVRARRIEHALNPQTSVDQDQVRTPEDRLAVRTWVDRQMKPVPGELPHLVGPAGQKLPVHLIRAAGGGVIPKHLRPVVVGVDTEADEPHSIPGRRAFELVLDSPQRGDDIRTDFAAAGEGEMRDPHRGVELGGTEAAASLIGQREWRQFGVGAGRRGDRVAAATQDPRLCHSRGTLLRSQARALPRAPQPSRSDSSRYLLPSTNVV